MDLTLLGTGCPQVSVERYGPATLVRAGAMRLLIDCGSGVTQRLLGAGCRGPEIDALLLTHLHSDHVIDLYQLIVSSWHQGRDRPQVVYGPPGTRRFVDGLMATWAPERAQRIAFEKRASTRALEVEVHEVGAGVLLERDGLRVTTVEVDHRPVQPAFGFIFESGGRKLALSGDTRCCPALIAAAAGADVLVHECFIHREIAARPDVRAETLEAVASYHTISNEVGKVAAEAGVRCLVLNHFVPVSFDRAALLAEVRRDYGGPVVIGEDLMQIDVETGMIRHAGGVMGLPQAGS